MLKLMDEQSPPLTFKPIPERLRLSMRWLELCTSAGLHDERKVELQKLLEGYSQPHRVYHNLTHLLAVILRLDRLADTAITEAQLRGVFLEPTAVYFAAFFHDIFYMIGSADNEEQSALLAEESLRVLGAS